VAIVVQVMPQATDATGQGAVTARLAMPHVLDDSLPFHDFTGVGDQLFEHRDQLFAHVMPTVGTY
jgi:hypothetical protein